MVPPDPPFVKVNVDAKFVQELKKAWSGIVIRDGNGDILGASVRLQNYSSSSFCAEAWATVHGLQFAIDLGCHSIVFESDCRTVIHKLYGNKVAHAMAAKGPSYFSDEFWTENARARALTVIAEDRKSFI
ncbi:hypothetical protein V6N11_073092 [Hibiscus sabdariffa]|uniref:RNase H type-1 domain-containing protein n=1 Tax=Hibiscus sabdariffa TaxID=183260 RepID=A0ABR2P937_9ROSI